jgi:hypothetical protein
MAPHEYRTVVFIVDPIAEVTVPCRIVIISISGEISINYRSRGRGVCRTDISAAVDDRCRSNIGMRNNGQTNSDMSGADTGADEYLSITFCSGEAGGYNGGEDK